MKPDWEVWSSNKKCAPETKSMWMYCACQVGSLACAAWHPALSQTHSLGQYRIHFPSRISSYFLRKSIFPARQQNLSQSHNFQATSIASSYRCGVMTGRGKRIQYWSPASVTAAQSERAPVTLWNTQVFTYFEGEGVRTFYFNNIGKF